MSAPRFFCPLPLQAHTTLPLPADVAHHAVRVRRLRDATPVILFNGHGGEYPAVLRVEGKQVWCHLGEHVEREAELPGAIVLVQGLAGGDKMDWIIEKAVELGVTGVVPIAAQRSVLQLSGERLEKRLAHWQRIVESASEQCGRNRLLQVHPPRTLQAFLQESGAHALRTTYLCHPEAPRALRDALGGPAETLSFMVGPEGGWSDDEYALAQRYSVATVRFGDRILRTETAGLAMASAASALLGWI